MCKTIENIASTSGSSPTLQKLLGNQAEVVSALWTCYTFSTNTDQLRIAAIGALNMLAAHSAPIAATLVDKVGIDTLLDCMMHTNSEIQQGALTLLAIYANEPAVYNKSLNDRRPLLAKLVPVYESTNVACRAKAYLLTYILIRQQEDTLLQLIQSKYRQKKFGDFSCFGVYICPFFRLVNSMERDNRKVFQSKEEDEYIHKILGKLIDLIFAFASSLLGKRSETGIHLPVFV